MICIFLDISWNLYVRAKQQSLQHVILPLLWSWNFEAIEIKSFEEMKKPQNLVLMGHNASSQEKYLLCKLMDRASEMQPHM